MRITSPCGLVSWLFEDVCGVVCIASFIRGGCDYQIGSTAASTQCVKIPLLRVAEAATGGACRGVSRRVELRTSVARRSRVRRRFALPRRVTADSWPPLAGFVSDAELDVRALRSTTEPISVHQQYVSRGQSWFSPTQREYGVATVQLRP
jgi:hypothetical protein